MEKTISINNTNKITFKNTRKIFLWTFAFSILGSVNLFIDNIMTGWLGENQLVGVAMVSSIAPIIIAFFSAAKLLFDGKIISSKRLGNFGESRVYATYSLIYQAISVIALCAVLIPMQKILIDSRLNNDAQAIQEAHKYFYFELSSAIIIGISLNQNLQFTLFKRNGLLTIISISTIVINFAVSYIFAYKLDMGVAGLGIGTLVSVSIQLMIKMLILFAHEEIRKVLQPIKTKIVFKKMFEKIYSIPYEILFFVLEYTFFYLITIYFKEYVVIYSLSRPFMYVFVGSVGLSQIIQYHSGQRVLDKKDIKHIFIISWLRLIIVSCIGASLISVLILVSGFYNVAWSYKVKSIYLLVTIILISSMTSQFYNLAYNKAYLSTFYKKFIFLDLFSKFVAILTIVTVHYSKNESGFIELIILISMYRIISDLVPFIFTRSKNNNFISD